MKSRRADCKTVCACVVLVYLAIQLQFSIAAGSLKRAQNSIQPAPLPWRFASPTGAEKKTTVGGKIANECRSEQANR